MQLMISEHTKGKHSVDLNCSEDFITSSLQLIMEIIKSRTKGEEYIDIINAIVDDIRDGKTLLDSSEITGLGGEYSGRYC